MVRVCPLCGLASRKRGLAGPPFLGCNGCHHGSRHSYARCAIWYGPTHHQAHFRNVTARTGGVDAWLAACTYPKRLSRPRPAAAGPTGPLPSWRRSSSARPSSRAGARSPVRRGVNRRRPHQGEAAVVGSTPPDAIAPCSRAGSEGCEPQPDRDHSWHPIRRLAVTGPECAVARNRRTDADYGGDSSGAKRPWLGAAEASSDRLAHKAHRRVPPWPASAARDP